MKPSNQLRSFLLAAGSSLLAVSSASAQATLTWDTAATAGIQGGTGAWNTTNTNWTTDGGANNVSWDNTSPSVNTALFDANGIAGTGTVTLGQTINLKALTFSNLRNSGPTQKYTITGGTLAFSSGGTITTGTTLDNVNDAEYASINSAITGAPNVSLSWSGGNNVLVFAPASGSSQALGTVTGAGIVKLAGSSTGNTIVGLNSASNGKIRLTSGSWTLTGTATGYEHFITGGTLIISGSGSLQNNNRATNFSGGTLHWNTAGAIKDNTISTARDRDFNITGGSIDNTSGAAITSSHNPQVLWGGNWTFIGSNGANSNLNMGTGDVFITGATRQVTVTNAATTLTVGGVVAQNGGTYGLTKAGAGTLLLTNSNTYSGTTTVNAGTLTTARSATTGTPFGTGAVAVDAGILRIAPSGSGSAIAFTGGTVAANTNFTYGAGATLELARGTQTSLTYTYGSSSAGTAFARGTNGTLILSTSNIANFGADGTKLERFIINSGSTAPTTVNGIVSGVVIQDRNTTNTGDFSGYNGTDGFTKATYTATDFTGATNASVLDITSASTSGATDAYALRVSGTVTNTGNTITLGSSGNPTAGIILNGGTISGGTLITPTSSATQFAIYTSGTSAISSSINTATSQTGLSVFGPGSLNLSDSTGNSFIGGLRINNSTVIADDNNQLGDSVSAITLTGGMLQTSGTFALGGGIRAITLAAGQNQTGGIINVTSDTTTYQNSSTGSKVMSGSGSLTKTGAGTLVLSGNTANTYTGGTFVNVGTLQLGAANMLADAGAVTVGGGTFDIQGNNETVGVVTLSSGNIDGSGGTLSGTSYNVQSGSISAKLSGAAVALTKTTAGTVTLSGANSYTGATAVDAGTLNIASTGSTHASSTVTVSNSGSALVVDGTVNGALVANASTTISGIGTVVGAATVSGNLTPGNSPGELNFTNSLTLANSTATTMEINGDTLGLNYDNIDVGTALTYDGALTLAIGAVFGSDTVFDLFEFGSQSNSFDSVALTGSYIGTLTNDGFGVWTTTTNSGDETWSFSQATGDLTLTVIPEPSAALLGGLGMLALLRRRRS